MSTIQELEVEIEKIKERNKRVEREKAWEVSWTRRIMIAISTYTIIAIFFFFIGTDEPLKDSIVPSLAFIISALSAPLLKRFWLRYIFKK